jgi:uncharacterized membrane protein YcfT
MENKNISVATSETVNAPVRTGRVAINFATGYFLISIFMMLCIVSSPNGQSNYENVLIGIIGPISVIGSFLISGFFFVNVLVSHFEELARTSINSK